MEQQQQKNRRFGKSIFRLEVFMDYVTGRVRENTRQIGGAEIIGLLLLKLVKKLLLLEILLTVKVFFEHTVHLA